MTWVTLERGIHRLRFLFFAILMGGLAVMGDGWPRQRATFSPGIVPKPALWWETVGDSQGEKTDHIWPLAPFTAAFEILPKDDSNAAELEAALVRRRRPVGSCWHCALVKSGRHFHFGEGIAPCDVLLLRHAPYHTNIFCKQEHQV